MRRWLRLWEYGQTTFMTDRTPLMRDFPSLFLWVEYELHIFLGNTFRLISVTVFVTVSLIPRHIQWLGWLSLWLLPLRGRSSSTSWMSFSGCRVSPPEGLWSFQSQTWPGLLVERLTSWSELCTSSQQSTCNEFLWLMLSCCYPTVGLLFDSSISVTTE